MITATNSLLSNRTVSLLWKYCNSLLYNRHCYVTIEMQQTHYYTTGTAMLPWKCNMVHRSCYQGKPNMSQYASDAWTLSKSDERWLSVFERGMLRCIFWAVQENDVCRKRYNHELYELFNEPDIVKHIKINRLGWAGYIIRMDNNRTDNKVSPS
jgi:hypothetical protein